MKRSLFAFLLVAPLVAQTHSIRTVAGSGACCNPVLDGATALGADLLGPAHVALGADGTLFVAELTGGVFAIDPSGSIRTIVTRNTGALWSAIAIDSHGRLYLADLSSHQIIRVLSDGTRQHFAGRGAGFRGDGGPAVDASFNGIEGLAVDVLDRVYVSDRGNGRVRVIGADGIVQTHAGNGCKGEARRDGASALEACIAPGPLAIDAEGNLFIGEWYVPEGLPLVASNQRSAIRQVTPDGAIRTLLSGSEQQESLSLPLALAAASDGVLYFADFYRVRRLQNGVTETIAGALEQGLPADAENAAGVRFASPQGLAVDRSGSVRVADVVSGRVFVIARSE